MNSKKFSRLFEDSRFLFLISFVVAVLLWMYVVVYVNNEHTDVIRNVPINVQYRQSAYQSLGLDVIEMDIETVNVSVTGPRSVTGNLTADDIIVYPNITGVDGAGKYTVTLTAEKTSSVKNFSINSLSRDTVTIRLDKVISKDFPVEADISSIVVAGDYMADLPITSPSTITITGPEYKVSTIDKVVAATVQQQTLNQTTVFTSEVLLYDESGNLMDHNLLTLSAEEIDITVPIIKEITVPLKVDYINVPDGFNTDTLHQSLSVSEIRLAVPAKDADSISEFVAGYIDLSTLQTDTSYTFDIKLPAGWRSIDDITQVTASISSANLVEKNVSVSEIKVINDAENLIEVLTQVINNVTIVGEAQAVEELSIGGVIAQIDASRLTAAQGQQSVQVSFIIPSTDKVYVKGVYNVTIRI